MGVLRKYGSLLLVLIFILFTITLPDALLRFIPSPTGNPLDLVFLISLIAIIFIFWKA